MSDQSQVQTDLNPFAPAQPPSESVQPVAAVMVDTTMVAQAAPLATPVVAQTASPFEITSDVPVPPSRFHALQPGVQYPIAQLQVGQTFFVPTESPKKVQSSLSAAINRVKKATKESTGVDVSYTTRSLEEVGKDGVKRKGVRVWRLA